jgi:hypothetical protein
MNFRIVILSVASAAALLGQVCNSASALPIKGSLIYTSIGDSHKDKTGLCKIYKSSGDADNPVVESRCPGGPNGWPVTMFSADARDVVYFGKEAAGEHTAEALQGAFADPHSTIEWHVSGNVPYAAIHRYFSGANQVLTVHKLNPDHTSCVAAVVAVERGRDANIEAARFADQIVPDFRCGVDKLANIGAVDALLQPK